jgi:TIR domain-containing protein
MDDPTKAVFLSYSSEDVEVARRICNALRDAGIEVWFDQSELRGGDAWDTAIRKQIKACTLFLPISSINSSVRPEGYFRLEWKLAVDRSYLMAASRAFLVPIVVDEIKDADTNVPDRFREMQWIALRDGQPTPAFIERVASLIARAGQSDNQRHERAQGPALVGGTATSRAGAK